MKRFLALPLILLVAACMSYPAPPPITPGPPGGVYRAQGTEPFWDLTIDRARMVFTDRGNNLSIVQATPRVIVGVAGEIYQAQQLNVNIVHARCSDGMSDRVYPDRVTVDANGRRYNGCGGAAPVLPNTLSGTRWRVVSVNARPTPAGDKYFMDFDAARFSAKFGCNGMGANYRQIGPTLYPGPVMGTKMACPNMSFEMDAGAILSQPLTITDSGTDSIVLTSKPGTIALRRSY